LQNNFGITETFDIGNTICEILTIELDTEKVVRRYQDSIVAASKKSFKVRKLTQKSIGYKSVPWWTKELTIMRKN